MRLLRYQLFKSTYEWLLDQNLTPYFLVNADFSKVIVPREFVEDGEIVLDASADAVDEMVFDAEGISFAAGFDEGEFRVYFPLAAILALYAAENEQGIFTTEDPSTLLVQDKMLSVPPAAEEKAEKVAPRRGNLKLIK